jgi:hypothetical protein
MQFFTQAIKQHGLPEKSAVDGYPATHAAINELKAKNVLPQNTKVRTSKYSNNLTLASSAQSEESVFIQCWGSRVSGMQQSRPAEANYCTR